MKDLASLQTFLADVLRRRSSLVSDPDLVARAPSIATGNERLSPIQQIDLYREQFFFRHIDCLRDDFKAIERLLGDAPFAELARAYLEVAPPDSFTLRDLGRDFAKFLATTRPWSEDPLLVEIARVEWAFVEAFDGPDSPTFDPALIAGIPEEAWPSARIVLDAALQRLALEYPAHDYRIAARNRQKDEVEPRPEPRRCFVLIGRGSDALTAWDVNADAFALIEELANGMALGEACEHAANASGIPLEAFQGKLAGWFSEWTARGWIRRVVV